MTPPDFDDARVRRAVGYKPDSDAREAIYCEECGRRHDRRLHGLTAPVTDNEGRPTTLTIAPAIVLPLSLAQRILAFLEQEEAAGKYTGIPMPRDALAAELRERLPK